MRGRVIPALFFYWKKSDIIDVTADLMEVGNMEYNEELDAYMVEDADYCADFAKSEFADDDVEVEIEEL